jgi:hypothetical protein
MKKSELKSLIKEVIQEMNGTGQNYRWDDGTEITLDGWGNVIAAKYKDQEISGKEFKDVGYRNGWTREDEKKFNQDIKGAKGYYVHMNRRGTNNVEIYPELKIVAHSDSSD